MRISDWSSDVCSSDLTPAIKAGEQRCESTYIKGCYTAPPRSIGRLQNCVLRIKASEAANVDDADAGNGKRTGHHCPEGEWNFLTQRPIITHVLLKIGRAHVELQSPMRNSYAVFCLKKKKKS